MKPLFLFTLVQIMGRTLFEPRVCWHHQWDEVPGGPQKACSWQDKGRWWSPEATGDTACFFGPLGVSRRRQSGTEVAGAKRTSLKWRVRELGEFSPERRRHGVSQQEPIANHASPDGSYKTDRAQCLLQVADGKTTDKKPRLELGRMDIRENISQRWGLSTLGGFQDSARQCQGSPDLVR